MMDWWKTTITLDKNLQLQIEKWLKKGKNSVTADDSSITVNI